MSTAISGLVGTTALLEGGLVPLAGYAAALLKWTCSTRCCRYRAAQEAINNALKYCHGHHIWVDLERAGGLQTLSISDDGVGIGPEEMERAAGLGLHSLRHRASLLGGSCTVTRNGLGGTTVAISYPLPEDSGHAQQMR
ncbi:ATP-binding protein [Paraburkholderia sp. PGU19]|uniref:sensor histidine kinase n=1 Tax=Paraburkholderia sp. PGU19 TaxID=2735434 RepID=UPI001FB14D38|nr:ATP-binding protein [Paraburkholderia sp. PGU19]